MAPSKSKFKTMLLFMEMEKNMELDIENSDENQMKGADNDHEKVNEQD